MISIVKSKSCNTIPKENKYAIKFLTLVDGILNRVEYLFKDVNKHMECFIFRNNLTVNIGTVYKTNKSNEDYILIKLCEKNYTVNLKLDTEEDFKTELDLYKAMFKVVDTILIGFNNNFKFDDKSPYRIINRYMCDVDVNNDKEYIEKLVKEAEEIVNA